ncbi:MAG: helix-turn-helix transcriptional regulator [Christensenellales bacterium]|jgi:AraC-like DNA-binding protein
MVTKQPQLKKIKRKYGSWIYRYLVSYVLILVIPCSLIVALYSTLSSQLLNAMNNDNINKITVAANIVDSALEMAHEHSYRLFNNLRFRQYFNQRSGYNAYELMNIIKLYNDSATFTKDFGVWDRANAKLVTSNGSYSDTSYFDNNLMLTYPGEAITALRSMAQQKIMKFSAINGDSIYIYLCPFGSFRSPVNYDNGAFLTVISEAEMLSYLRHFVGNEGVLEVDIASESSIRPSSNDNEIFYKHITKHNIPLRISLCMGADSLSIRIKRMNCEYITIIIIAVFLCLGLAILMSYRNFRPIQRLLHGLIPFSSYEFEGKDELMRIGRIVGQIVTSNDELGQRINEQKNVIRQHGLSLLLLDKADKGVIDSLADLGIPVIGHFCFVTLVYAVKGNAGIINDSVIRILEHTTYPASLEVYAIEMEQLNCVAAIVVYTGSGNNVLESFTSHQNRFCSMLRRAVDANNLQVGINTGQIVKEMSVVSKSLDEAISLGMDSIQDKMFFPTKIPAQVWKSINSKAVTLLIHALRNGNIDHLNHYLDNVFQEIGEQAPSSLLRRSSYYDFFGCIIGTVYDLKAESPPDEIEIALISMRREEFQNLLKQWLHTVCEHVACMRQDAKNKKTNEVIRYIMEHYDDYNLCIDTLIDTFEISANQISRLLRQKTGYGFREYLINLRMIHARNLLLNSDLAIKEIAEHVGYGSSSYFIKTFKAFYGLAPAQYRNQRRSEE